MVPPLGCPTRASLAPLRRDAVTRPALAVGSPVGSADGIGLASVTDRLSTVGHLDVYVDRRTGLRLSIARFVGAAEEGRWARSAVLSSDIRRHEAGRPTKVTPKDPPFQSGFRTTGTPDLG
jgi:hypothetical protein